MTTDILIWISGASSGIGRGLADTAPWDGARIIDISRRGADGCEHVPADLTTVEGWQAAADSFEKELAGFQGERVVFVHCAGTLQPMGFAGEVDHDAYTNQVLLNSAAPQVLGDAFVAAVRDLDVDSHLIMISSGAASSVYEGWSAYGPGKAAVDHWVRIVGAERARRGSRLRVVSVAPGVIDTRMQAQIRSTPQEEFPAVEKFVDLHEQDDLVAPEDAARGIWSLLDRDLDNGAVVDLRDLD
ncbi:MAG TPA: SDR family NAD(P)-dependent oxidoreductase [Nitriliruptorales bacterium]|nr:SDR family NAD(P)-dependent oxidoreductase [Nitriliruptorales bacterium]